MGAESQQRILLSHPDAFQANSQADIPLAVTGLETLGSWTRYVKCSVEDTEMWRGCVAGPPHRYWGSVGGCRMWPWPLPLSAAVFDTKQQRRLFSSSVSDRIVQSPWSSNLFSLNLTMFSLSFLSLFEQRSFPSLLSCIHTGWKLLNSEPQTCKNEGKWLQQQHFGFPGIPKPLMKHYQEHRN